MVLYKFMHLQRINYRIDGYLMRMRMSARFSLRDTNEIGSRYSILYNLSL